MFSVDEATAEAIRRAYDEGGELSGIVEFRRHFPLISDNAKAGECVRIIAGWKPMPDRPQQPARPPRARRTCLKGPPAPYKPHRAPPPQPHPGSPPRAACTASGPCAEPG